MKTHKPFFKTLLLVLLATLYPFLSGCAPMIIAAAAAPYALIAYSYLPSGTEVELESENGGAVSTQLASVRKVVTDNLYAKKYLKESGLFTKVGYVKTQPNTTFDAAKLARRYGYDAFLMVDSGGPSYEAGFLKAKRIYGSARVTMVARDGERLYEQGVYLKGDMKNYKNYSERQVAEILARVLVDDLKKSRQLAAHGEIMRPDQPNGLLGKIQNVFN